MRYFREEWARMKRSLDLNAIGVSMVLDVAFWFLILGTLTIYLRTLTVLASPFAGVDRMTFQMDILDPVKIGIYQKSIIMFMIEAFLLTILLFIVLSMITGIFKGMIWDTIKKKQVSIKRALRYSLLTLYFIVFTITVVLLSVSVIMPPVSYIIVISAILLALHLSIRAYDLMAENQRHWHSFKKCWSSLKNIHHSVIPYIAIGILSIVAISSSWLFNLPVRNLLYGSVISTVLASLILLGVLAWGRIYLMQTFAK